MPVANNATGTLSLQVQNPAPGGGAGTTFTESVQPNSITLTATGPDGINTGFGDIDFSVAMSAAVTGSAQTAVNWSVAGAGSISSAGVYTPPAVMPANPAVTIQAALASNPAITASYALTLVNPVPVITQRLPEPAIGRRHSLGCLDRDRLCIRNGLDRQFGTVTTTYNSSTSITAQITLPATASGNLSLAAQNPTPGGGTGVALVLPIAGLTMTATNSDGTPIPARRSWGSGQSDHERCKWGRQRESLDAAGSRDSHAPTTRTMPGLPTCASDHAGKLRA